MADDSWDAEDYDVDKGFIDDAKEEEEDLALAEVSEPEPQPKPKQGAKPPKSKDEKIMEKKAQRRAEVLADNDGVEVDSKPITEEEDKERRVELQKESDLRLAMETFGVAEEGSTLESMNPQSEEDFGQFKDALAAKITQYKTSSYYNKFLEQLLIKCCGSFEASDLRHLSAVLSTMATEKQKSKSSKAATKKKMKASLGSRAVGKGAKRLDDMDYDNDLGADFDDFI